MTTVSNSFQKGYIQVYTGNGKGKTTAALGLALRASGAGLNVFIAQFIKGIECSELEILEKFSDQITIRQYGRGCFIKNKAAQEDIDAARKGLEDCRKMLTSGAFQVVILDEANVATYYKLFSVDSLLELIDSKPENVELIITGRNADPRIIEKADLVTEMKEVKHYYKDGVQARKGIES